MLSYSESKRKTETNEVSRRETHQLDKMFEQLLNATSDDRNSSVSSFHSGNSASLTRTRWISKAALTKKREREKGVEKL